MDPCGATTSMVSYDTRKRGGNIITSDQQKNTAGEMTTPTNQSIEQLNGLMSSVPVATEGIHLKEIKDEQVAELLLEVTELKQEIIEHKVQHEIIRGEVEQEIKEEKNQEIIFDMKQEFVVVQDENTESQDVTEGRKKQITDDGKEEIKENEKEQNSDEGKETITDELKKQMADILNHITAVNENVIEQTEKEMTGEVKQECAEEVEEQSTQKKMVTQDIPVVEDRTTECKKQEEESFPAVRLNEATNEGHASIQAGEHLDVLGKLRKYTQPISALKTEWVSLRDVNHCKCGMEFSYSAKKVSHNMLSFYYIGHILTTSILISVQLYCLWRGCVLSLWELPYFSAVCDYLKPLSCV